MMLILAFLLLLQNFSIQCSPLDDYVFAPDPHYGYTLLYTYNMTDYTLLIYNFTSQKWYDETVTDRPIWWHYLCITIPDVVTKPDVGYLLIDGNSNNDGLPKPTDPFVEITSMFAVSTGTIGIDLQQVPNEPIRFKNDPSGQSHYEDAAIAWSWKVFLDNTSYSYMPLFVPMTKAAVRAMDAVTEITKSKGVADLKKFMVAGASKRGWTTWTTAAVDPTRVFAAVPIVMDLLNINSNFHHQYKSLGGWSFAFGDFFNINITTYMDTPQMSALERIIDPISYLDRFVNTNFLLFNSAGDEYFLPDDSDYFWTQFRAATNGSAMVRRLPNADHYCVGHIISIFFSMRSFFLSIYYKQPLPRMTWTRPNNSTHGIITVTVDIQNGPVPINATVFYARTLDNKRRDFRLFIANPNNTDKSIPHPVVWSSDSKLVQEEISTPSRIKYTAAIQRPLSGWLGFFFQLSFNGPEDTVLQISSEVNIVPETFPFDDCYQETCKGSII